MALASSSYESSEACFRVVLDSAEDLYTEVMPDDEDGQPARLVSFTQKLSGHRMALVLTDMERAWQVVLAFKEFKSHVGQLGVASHSWSSYFGMLRQAFDKYGSVNAYIEDNGNATVTLTYALQSVQTHRFLFVYRKQHSQVDLTGELVLSELDAAKRTLALQTAFHELLAFKRKARVSEGSSGGASVCHVCSHLHQLPRPS